MLEGPSITKFNAASAIVYVRSVNCVIVNEVMIQSKISIVKVAVAGVTVL